MPSTPPHLRQVVVVLLVVGLVLAACATQPPSRSQMVTPAASGPEWARGAVFYEIFVRSFADSDGDGVGDLRGLRSKLDYLNDGDPSRSGDLGVDALWLMPIFESPSYHGYDTVDYERVDSEYGTEEDLRTLLADCHRRGIRVILDLVLNHTSDQHPWFAESAAGPASPRRDWYLWRADDPGWTQPWGGSNRTWHPRGGAWYYGIFWGGMPDLDYANPAVRAEMKRVAERWLRAGVDGFRLDATRHLFADGPGERQNDRPETHAFLRELAAHVRAVRPDVLLVGENWTDTPTIATYFGERGDELAMNFNFPLASALVEAARSGDAGAPARVLREMAALYPAAALDAPFLTNHDMVRVATQLAGDPRALRQAAALLLTLPGAPFVYYGEEIGLPNGPGTRDEEKRTPMPWDTGPGAGFTTGTPWKPPVAAPAGSDVAAQTADPGSLLAHYRSLIALRRTNTALRSGSLDLLHPAPGDGGTLLAFLRRGADGTLLIAHNLDQAATSLALEVSAADARMIWIDGDGARLEPGAAGTRLELGARTSAVWRLAER